MRTGFLIYLTLTFTFFSMAKEDKINLVESAPNEEAIKQSFAGKFGTIRMIYSKDRRYLAFAHDRASGVIKEDIYIYQYQSHEWVLIGMVHASSLACWAIDINENDLVVLDFKRQLIAQFRQPKNN